MIAQQGQPLGIELVDAPGAFAAIANQAGVLQYAQVLRDSGARYRQSGGKLVYRERLVPQHLEDGQAGGIPQGGQAILYVSIHLR